MTHIFIFNPNSNAGGSSRKLREKLTQFSDLHYFIFIMRKNDTTAEMISRILRIFEGEKLRIYCCGGSGTIRNVISCFDDLDSVEFAFYPLGLTNDFLKVFGSEQEHFHHIEELIYGRVVDIDYIRSNCGSALNTFSTGIDYAYQKAFSKHSGFAVLHPVAPYLISAVSALTYPRTYSYRVTVDDKEIEQPMTEIVFANGCVLGGFMHFSETADITDGKANYYVVPRFGFGSRINLIARSAKSDFSYVNRTSIAGETKSICIRRSDNEPFAMNADGELIEGITECRAEVVRRGLHFVIPRDITVRL